MVVTDKNCSVTLIINKHNVISSITFMFVWFIINITMNNFGEKVHIVQCLSSLVDIYIECSHRYNISYAFLHIISNKHFHALSVFHMLVILKFYIIQSC